MEKMIHNSPKTTAIRQRMEEVRCELDEDVQEFVEDARGMGQWRYYVRTYPWVCVGAAVAAGYFVVPRRPVGIQVDAPASPGMANQSRLLATSHVSAAGDARGMLLRFLGNLVMRGVSLYIEQQAGKLFAPAAAKSPQADKSPQDDNLEKPHS
jgi:hypothetical protein